ncbi:collectin-12-like isoform X1 [Poecilia latipinna]|uniref:collectin-12-like isoform X1 n=1 Tax=Poecilia latipinna TaxID=48699 RepID=UPI00072E4B4F|nr:PREDICTED: collectin-12-like isoform X1 [Poecilia latipinna]XP_014901830.1 PREDICTED: collectin-12-like isoform X1 [Poecilia latipinna]
MPEVEVTYSEVKFTKSVPKDNNSSSTDTTYAEVQISKQEDTKDLSIHVQKKEADVQQPDRKSKMSPAVLVVLISLVVLLAAAASGLVALYITNNKALQSLNEEIDMLKKNISQSIDQPTSPPPATCPSCPATPSSPTSGTTEPLLPTSPPSTSPPSTSPPSTCPPSTCPPSTCPPSTSPPSTCPPSTCPPSTCPPTNTTRNLTCEAGWEKHGGSLYYFNTSKSSWTDSRRSCADLGSDLVKIDSREEQVFLIGRVRDLMKDNQDKFWIGLTDSKEEGKWLWMDGSALDQSLSFWNQTQPDNKSPAHSAEAEADCVRMGKKEKKGGSDDLKSWFDTSCKRPQKSICEKTAKLSSSV